MVRVMERGIETLVRVTERGTEALLRVIGAAAQALNWIQSERLVDGEAYGGNVWLMETRGTASEADGGKEAVGGSGADACACPAGTRQRDKASD